MKRFLAVAAGILMLFPLSADYKDNYYSPMDGTSRAALKEAAKQSAASHTRLGYSDLPSYWQYTDIYPELHEGSPRWWDMYSSEIYLILSSQTARQSFSAHGMQREHSTPKSWWKEGNDVEYTPAYTDLWNLYPSDGSANNAKSNYPPGECNEAKIYFDNGITRVGAPADGQGYGWSRVFEPADEYKGDFARSYFYMATVYDDLRWTGTAIFANEQWPTIIPWAMDVLLAWSRQDPVSQKEIDRNDAVEQQQGNRNPFIDFPELAEYIWGCRTADTFSISEQEKAAPATQLTPLTPVTARDAAKTSATSYTASWDAAPEDVEGYEFVRVRKEGQISVSSTQFTTLTSVSVSDLDPEGEKYWVRSVKGGRRSLPGNVISVEGKASAGSMTAAAFRANGIQGGIRISTGGQQYDIEVYDITGRRAARVKDVSDGMIISLPAGVYIVRPTQGSDSVKVIVR